MGILLKKAVAHPCKILNIMNREGVVPLECVSLQRSLEHIDQHLGVLYVWLGFHLKRFDIMEGISGPIVLPKIEWTIGW